MSVSGFTSETQARDTGALLRRLRDMVAEARPMPLSASVMVNRDEVVRLLDEAAEGLPEEVRQARWLLKEREEYLEKVRREGEEVLEAARQRAEDMVQRTELVRQAHHRADQTLEEAREAANRLRREAEDYCAERLARFEAALERTLAQVRAGQEKLRATPPPPGSEPDADDRGDVFFDQDRE
jgi:vacuolar-type H+-ATPase subunit H